MSRPRVLVARAGALGDILLLRPALVGLKGAGFDVTLLAPTPAARVLESPGSVDVLPWESPEVASLLADADAAAFDRRLRELTAALAVTSSEPLLAALRARVDRVVAVDPRPEPGVHAARWFAQGAEALGAPRLAAPPVLRPTPDERSQSLELAPQLRQEFIAIHPGSGSPAKNWSASGFAALADSVAPGLPVALVAGPADAGAVTALAARLPRAVRLETVPLRLLGALLSRACLYVGNDSGISHLAAAFGAPTLALFGPTDPEMWAPMGPHVRTLRAPGGDLAALAPRAVIEIAGAFRSEVRGRPAG